MKFKEAVAQFFGAASEAGVTFDGTPENMTEALADPRVAELQAQIAAMQQQARQSAASAFVAGLVSARRTMPAQAAGLVALHVQAATDDARDNGTRTATLEAALSAQPQHAMTQELIGSAPLLGLAQNAAETENKAAQKKRLLGMTALGRDALKEAR